MKKNFYYLLIGVFYVLSLFPLSCLRKLACKLGPTILKQDERTLRVINKNLRLCFPNSSEFEYKQLLNERLACMFQILFEMSHVWIKPTDKLIPYLQPTYDNQVFESEIKNDNGVIVLIPHIGNWEVMNVYLSQFRQLTAMYQPFKNPQFNRFILKSRERLGSVLVPTSNKGVAEVMKTLKKGGMVAFLPDQTPDKSASGVFAPLFQHDAYTATLAHKLALKTNAQVFIGTAFQCNKGFSIDVKPMKEQYYSVDPQVAATCLNRTIEELILKHPAQNQWEYKRYRVQPNEQLSLYRR